MGKKSHILSAVKRWRTFGTDAYDDVFYFLGLEAFGQGDEGDGVVFKAVGLSTSGAGEVDMVEVVVILATADTILANARTVIYLMEDLLFREQAKCPKDAGAIHLGKPFFHIG